MSWDEIRAEYGIDLIAPDISGAYAACSSTLRSTIYPNVFDLDLEADVSQLLQENQDSIIYD